MPQDDITAEEVRTQVEAEVEYHKAQNSIVAILPRIKNPTLVITSSNDLTNPPSNEVGFYPYGQQWIIVLSPVCRGSVKAIQAFLTASLA